MNQESKIRLSKLVTRWISQEIKVNPGLSAETITELESDFKFRFEENFCNYLLTVNGFEDFDSDSAWFSFWSASRIKEENTDGSHPHDMVWFSDHSINLCSFGFGKVDGKVYIHFQTIPGIEVVANSFNEFVDLYLEDPYLLLR